MNAETKSNPTKGREKGENGEKPRIPALESCSETFVG